MSGEIVIVDNGNDGVIAGDSAYLDLYQQVYKQLNRTEKEISKSYDDNLKIKFSDIKELHLKILQSIKSQNGIDILLKINMSQLRGETYTFNNFFDFESNNTSGPSPTQEIVLTYKYIIRNDESKTFERYKITVKLVSRVAQYYQAKNDAPEIMMEILAHFKSNVAIIDVEYYDYVKARSFIATFDEWIKGCHKTAEPKYLPKFKWFFNRLAWTVQLFILSVFTFSSYNHIDENLNDIFYVAKFFVLYLFIFYFIIKVVNNILEFIRKTINSYFFMSYIDMNKGDDNLINEHYLSNKNSIFKTIGGVFFTITIGVVSCYFYDLMKGLFV
ncbi:hypothetical protein RI835_000359 [Providencia rettgeri]|nr:hypothetical protein [Providencia rettgeri]